MLSYRMRKLILRVRSDYQVLVYEHWGTPWQDGDMAIVKQDLQSGQV